MTVRQQGHNHKWFRKLVTGKPHFVIGDDPANPYLIRRYLIPRNRFLNVYLHKFLRSDDDRALHDHPWWFVSIILKGGYLEWTPNEQFGIRRAPSIAFRRAEHTHRVELFSDTKGGLKPCWTIIITGKKAREWGFHCPQGFRVWEHFDRSGCD